MSRGNEFARRADLDARRPPIIFLALVFAVFSSSLSSVSSNLLFVFLIVSVYPATAAVAALARRRGSGLMTALIGGAKEARPPAPSQQLLRNPEDLQTQLLLLLPLLLHLPSHRLHILLLRLLLCFVAVPKAWSRSPSRLGRWAASQ